MEHRSVTARRLSVEALERRELLTIGSLLHTLDNPAPAANDRFGGSVALSENIAAVGAYWDDTGDLNAGAAYVFDASNGNLVHSIPNPAPEANDFFGFSVASSGNAVLVGAPLKDGMEARDTGAAYLFDAVSGALDHLLPNPTPDIADFFGFSVASSGNTALVGAPREDAGALKAGEAYLFDASSGAFLHAIMNPTPERNDQFGFSVALSGNVALVGAPMDNTAGTNTGAAYLFDVNSGALLHTLNNPTPAALDDFGVSVALSGNLALVGADGDDTGAASAGAAYLFDVTSGTLLHTFENPTPDDSDYFGFSVALSDNTALVGARFDDTSDIDAGTAYLFDVTTGALQETLRNPTSAAGDNFGLSVALSSNKAMVSAPLDDTLAPDAGAAYLFDTSTAVEVTIDIKPNSINLASNGVIAVAILTTDDFDALLVDASTVMFAGASAVHSAMEDVDGDGDLDMVLHFKVRETNLADIYAQLLADDIDGDGILDSSRQTAAVSLSGETTAGDEILGTDEVDLFFSGKALRDLLDQLARAGIL